MIFGIISWNSNIENQINGIRYIQMKVSWSNHRMQSRTVCIVHFWPKVWPDKILGETWHEIEHSGTIRVLWERQTLQEILETARKDLAEVLCRRPVLQFQYHRLPVRVLQSSGHLFESLPEMSHLVADQNDFVCTVNEVVLHVAKLFGKRFGKP